MITKIIMVSSVASFKAEAVTGKCAYQYLTHSRLLCVLFISYVAKLNHFLICVIAVFNRKVMLSWLVARGSVLC